MGAKRILVLVVYNENADHYITLYKNLKQQWLRYMNSNPIVKSYFICMKEDLEQEHLVTEDTVFIRGTESYIPGIHIKSCESIKILLNKPEFSDVEYVVRTNISSFWIWNRLIHYLKDIPKANVMISHFLETPHTGIFPWGCGFIMSRDVALIYTQNANHPLSKIKPDDVFVGSMVSEHNIIRISSPIYNVSDFHKEFIDSNLSKIPTNVFHIRNNYMSFESRLRYEVESYSKLILKHTDSCNINDQSQDSSACNI
jgi:hypothetical protein